MGILSRLLALPEKRGQHPSAAGGWDWLGGRASYAGPTITEESALTLSAYFACIRVLAESVAMLPLLVYERSGRNKQRATGHPLYQLLKESPNPEMTSFEFRETLVSHVAGWGNGFAEIEWGGDGRPVALWPLHPGQVQVVRRAGQLRYLCTVDGVTADLPAYRVHHVRGLSSQGIVGYSVARLAMQSIGLGMATEEYGGRFFGNGARPGVVLKHPGVLGDTAYERLKNSWNADHQGLSNAHRVKILEEGLSIDTIGVPPEEAQFLQTRQFQVAEIARWFRIPPHMIGDLSKATFSNIEEQALEFVIYTLSPWLVRSEQALTRDLLTEPERQKYFIEYLVNGLLRGNIASRFEGYQKAIQSGWMSPNEARELENMNPYSGGDVYLLPLNMTPTGTRQEDRKTGRQEDGTERRADDSDDDDDSADGESDHNKKWRRAKQKLARDYIPLFQDVTGRVVRREVADVRRAVGKQLRKRSVADFREWLTTFYEEFAGVIGEQFEPLLATYAAQVATATADELGKDDPGVDDGLRNFIKNYLAAMSKGHTASSRNQIEALITDAESNGQDAADLIEERLDGWESTRGEQMAAAQAYEAGNALAVALYVTFGVTRLYWAAAGKSCPFCQRLSGKVIGIDSYFVQKGDSVSGGPGDTPMRVRRNTRHGPLHKGCDCMVIAG